MTTELRQIALTQPVETLGQQPELALKALPVHHPTVISLICRSTRLLRSRRSLMPVTIICLLLLDVCSRTAHANASAASGAKPVDELAWVVEQSELCAVALRQAEQRYHLPPTLLMSIAKAESGRPITSPGDIRPWPWTIDADGSGLFLDSKAAAIAWIRSQLARHNFVDVGCMQVDLHYHPNAFRSMEDAFDPATNADYAAQVLLGLYSGEAGRDWDIAVGLYHSHTPMLAEEYRDRVALMGADVLHGTLKGVPLYVRAIRLGTLRLPLAGGRATLINVNRQPARRSRRSLSTCAIERILGNYLNGGQQHPACVTSAAR